MKRRIHHEWMTASAVILMLAAGSGRVMAQGSLTPPGAPAPTMKTLAQVEPRISISEAGYQIVTPGSYYLTTNIVTTSNSPGIRVSASNVVVDLNGFSILGIGGTEDGISIDASMVNVVVKNGTIRDCYHHGIYAGVAARCSFQHLRILNNGRASGYDGLQAGAEAVVEDCWIYGNGRDGLVVGSGSYVVGNQLTENGGVGLRLYGTNSYVANNIVRGNGDNYALADGNQLNLLLCEIPETLDWPCSVKLAGTLICTQTSTNGITVNSDDVTIDLDGHALIGPGTSSGHGIYQASSFRNLSVKNGKVVNWRGTSSCGISALGRGALIQDIQAATNYDGIGTGSDSTIRNCAAHRNSADGIAAGAGSTISDCTARDNGGYGIYAGAGSTISDCAAYKNGADGIYAAYGSTIHGCAAYANGDDGIVAAVGSTIRDCTARYNGGSGIYAGIGSTVSRCTASWNTGDGILASGDCLLFGNQCGYNGNGGDGAGIHVTSSDNRIEGNNVTVNDRGIDVDVSGNIIIRNTASGNTTNYDIATGNHYGQIISSPGSGFTNANPWANFSF